MKSDVQRLVLVLDMTLWERDKLRPQGQVKKVKPEVGLAPKRLEL